MTSIRLLFTHALLEVSSNASFHVEYVFYGRLCQLLTNYYILLEFLEIILHWDYFCYIKLD